MNSYTTKRRTSEMLNYILEKKLGMPIEDGSVQVKPVLVTNFESYPVVICSRTK